MYKKFKAFIRAEAIRFFNSMLSTEELQITLRNLAPNAAAVKPIAIKNQNVVCDSYDLGEWDKLPYEKSKDPIFISGRFRSGSTLLWNIFRQLDGFTSYYEPFNERRWFDKNNRGERVDSTHIGVDDYWLEYDGLSALSGFYQDDWIRKNLYMDQRHVDYDMKSYIDLMIAHSSNRPVLQFNRIDFRLPWIKSRYPNAKIIHIYRNPRNQYLSTLVNPKDFSQFDKKEDFKDYFYLNMWLNDLSGTFPILETLKDKHPYEKYYALWKLSYLFGKQWGDTSLALESLMENPQNVLSQLFSMLNINQQELEIAIKVIARQPNDKWKAYAEDSWFREKEQYCEQLISEYLYSLQGLKALF